MIRLGTKPQRSINVIKNRFAAQMFRLDWRMSSIKKAVLDDGPPVPVRPARDLHDDFVQVLDVAGMRLPSPPNVGDHRAELDGPAPDRVVRNFHATFQQQRFNRAQAQIEPGIEPDTMSNVRTHCDDESNLA